MSFWLPFAAVAALYAYAFRAGGLFRQEIWTQAGLARFGLFAAGYAVAAAVFRRRLPAVAAAGAIVFAAAAGGFPALAAVALFLFSSWALGSIIAPGILGMLLGVNLYAFLIGFAVHAPVNYPGVYAAAFALPILWRCRRLARHELRIPRLEAGWGSWVLGFILLAHLAVALKPESGADALAMHLAIPASVAEHHRWVFDPGHTAWAVMPMQADWAFTAVYLLGGEAAARLLNFAMLGVILVLLAGLVERGRLLQAALFASAPIVQLVTGSLFVENFWAATLFGAFASLVRYRENGELRWAAVSTLLAGAGLAAKYGMLAFLPPWAVLLTLELRRRRHTMLILALLALGLAPYIRACLETGNPVFPFFNAVFKSPLFDAERSFVDRRFDQRLKLSTPFDITFHTSRHLEAQDGGWAFQYLLLVPLALVTIRRRAGYAEASALAIGLVFSVLTLAGQSNARYLYPAIPLLAVSIGGLFARLEGARLRAATAAAAAAGLLNLWFLPASGWSHKDFFPGRKPPVRELVDHLNRRRPGEPVLFAETNQIAGFRGRAYTTSWHNQNFLRSLQAARSPAGCLALLQNLGIRRAVAPVQPRLVTHPHLRKILGPAELERGGWKIAALVEPPAFPPAGPGAYDDTDPRIEYEGEWLTGNEFEGASGRTVTYSDGSGAAARLTFEGSQVTWVYTRAANRGRALVTFDGRSREVDLHSAETIWQAQMSFSGPGSGRHTIEISVRDGYADIDAFIVR